MESIVLVSFQIPVFAVLIVQLIFQIEVKIDENQLIVAVFKRKTRDLCSNVEVIERDRPIYGPTLTADDRRVMNGIDAILADDKNRIDSFGLQTIRAMVVIVTLPMMIDDAVESAVVDVVMVAGFHRVMVEIIPMMNILGSRTTVLRASMMNISGFLECRDRESNCRNSIKVSLGRAGGYTSKTALRTIVGVNATNWRS